MEPLTFGLVVVAGVMTGILGGMFGIGGGIFLIPVLVMVFHLPMHQAIAASIVTVIATSSATAAVYVDKGLTNIRLGMSLEVMTTIGAVLGGLVANQVPGDTLRIIFSIFLLCMAAVMYWKSRSGKENIYPPTAETRISGVYIDPACGESVSYGVRRLGAGMGISFLAGNMSGLLGVGGGIIKVPVMSMVCGVPIKAATATSNFMIGVTAVASAFIYLAHGHVHPYYTAAAALGVFIGSRAGTMLGAKLSPRLLVRLFIGVMIITALRMIYQVSS